MNKLSLYSRMAFTNLRKNGQLYLPYLILGAGLVAMFYILLFLAGDPTLTEIRGGAYLPSIMNLGFIVVGILSIIMLLYTNSFLMKRRKTEFGLYNVLGMEKRHIAKVMLLETVYTALISIAGGLVLGVALYKGLTLFLLWLLGENARFGFYISFRCMLWTALFFAGIYLICCLWNLVQVARSKPIELLHSVHTGEKEPKVKWLLAIVGFAALGMGYYISITTESPLKSITDFFVAVLLVILGTYCLFTAGSIALLKLLKGSKRYYYHPRHMTAVSGLLYRMKQNAVGLASICILSTMVLVMLSTTVSLYAGIEDSINILCPYDLSIFATYGEDAEEQEVHAIEFQDTILELVQETAKEQSVPVEKMVRQDYLCEAYLLRDGELSTDRESLMADYTDSDIWSVWFLTEEQYQAVTGQSLNLGYNEVALCEPSSNTGALPDAFRLSGTDYTVAERLEEYPISFSEMTLFNCAGLVVPSEADVSRIYAAAQEAYGGNVSYRTHEVVVYFGDAEDERIRTMQGTLSERLYDRLMERVEESGGGGGYGTSLNSRLDMQDYMYGMVGGLFFLGLTLGAVFLLATVLIIYYKQVSEGYEDRARFQIMQKVGMSHAEVKRTIRSQILLVFFLPLGMAAVHLAAAYPLLVKLLRLFSLSSEGLFIGCCVGSLLMFAVGYTVVYWITARVYDKIVC